MKNSSRRFNYPRIRTECCFLAASAALLSLWPTSALAQLKSNTEGESSKQAVPVEKTTAQRPDPKAESSGDVLVLNPFEVNAQKDDGFMATNAGTATKLGIDLKDLAAPYSVMTGEFIKAMGITDLSEAALWTTNGAPVFDPSNADGIGASTMFYNRGALVNTGFQRNFFISAGIGDTYNVERIDFGRGPNAVLFSVGSNNVLGGGISSQGKRARFDRNADTATVTVGSWDYYRGTIDVNRVLTDKLAVRANAMLQKRKAWVQNEFDDRYGVTVAANYRIAPRTELRIEGVLDKVERLGAVVPYNDKLSGWNGSTVFDGRITNAMYSGNATPGATYGLTYNGEPQGIYRVQNNDYVYDPATNTVMNWIHSGFTREGDATARTPMYFDGGTVAWSREGNNEIPRIGNGNTSFYDTPNLPEDRFGRQIANSRFRIPSKRFSMMAKEPILRQRTRNINLGFTHQFSDTLFFELQGAFDRVDQNNMEQGTYGNLRYLKIDINRNLPNGQPNPHFLDAFGEMDMFKKQWKTDNVGLRTYLGYIKDLGKWGHYTFNLSLAGNQRVIDTRQRTRSMALAADPREWHAGSQRIRVHYYMNDPFRPFGDEVAPTSLYEVAPINGGNGGYTTSTITARPRWVLSNWDYRKEQTKYGIFAFAGRYFDNKLIISPGWRVDEQRSYFREKPTSWAFMPNDPNWDGETIDDRYWRPDAPADYYTLSFIPRNNDGTPRSKQPIPAWGARPTIAGVNDVNPANPLYANDRFRGDYNRPRYKKTILKSTAGLTYHAFDWMSVKLNYGDSYAPADTGNLTLTGEDLEPEVGIAYEAGLSFSLLKDRLFITPRYYFNRRENLRSNSGAIGQINNLMGVRAWNDPSPDGRNPFGYSNVLGWDTLAVKNSGYEVEIVGRITRGWRVSGSFGTAQNIEYDRWRNTRAYVLSRKDEYVDVLKAAGGTVDTSRKIDNPLGGTRFVDDAPGYAIEDPSITDSMITAAGGDTRRRRDAINYFNALWRFYDDILLQQEKAQLKRISAKLVTDYTVQTGALKGFRVLLACNYVDREISGYRGGDTIPNPNFDPSKPISRTNRADTDDPTVDLNTPLYVKRPLEFRTSFGYSRRLRSGMDLELQLNIINILNHQESFFRDRNTQLRPPGGDYTLPNRVTTASEIAYFQRPRSFEFTTTLKF